VNAPVTMPGAVQFEILSGYNPLPAKPAKEISATKDSDATKAAVGVKKAAPPKNSLSKKSLSGGVVKAPAQKGAPR
jgi:hypothetical protein